MSIEPLPPVRRVVTAINAQGRSYIAEAAAPAAVFTDPNRPGYVNSNVWITCSAPADIHQTDRIGEQRGLLPPQHGTIVRIIDYPPQAEDPEVRARQAAAAFSSMFSDGGHQAGHARHPGMHITDTVDYAIVLEGEIVAIMEEDEIVLRRGDVLVQRGTNHAWANRSGKMTRMAFILIDGTGTR